MPLETPAPAPVAAAPTAPTTPTAPVTPAPAAEPAPVAAAAPAAPPVAAPVQPAAAAIADPTVPLPKSLYDDLIAAKASLAVMQQRQEEEKRAAAQEQARLLAAKGEADAAFRLLQEQRDADLANERAQRAAVEERAKKYALDGELGRALADYSFQSPVARETFLNLVRGEFVVEAQGDSFAVRTPAFQPVAAAIAAKLSAPEYQFLLAPRGNPGGGTQPNPAAPQPVNPAAQLQPVPEPAAAPQPKNAGEALIQYYKAEKAKLAGQPAAGYVPNRPIGLAPIA